MEASNRTSDPVLELESRQDELLRQLDELNAELERLLAENQAFFASTPHFREVRNCTSG